MNMATLSADATAAESKAGQNPPLPVTIAALLALLAMAITRRDVVMPILVSLTISATWLTPFRLPARSMRVWLMRLGLFSVAGMIILATPLPNNGSIAVSAHIIDFLMLACAGEMAVQFWQRPMPSGSSAVLILFSGLAFVAASKTFERRYLSYLTPIFMSIMILALHSIRVRVAQRQVGMRWLWMRRALIVLALSIGLSTATLIYRYRKKIDRTGFDIAAALQTTQRSVGFSSSPTLGEVQSTELSMTRMLRVDGEMPESHLRGTAFYDYMKGGRWDPPADNRAYELHYTNALNPEAKGSRVNITRLNDDLETLFVPLHSAGVQIDEGGSLRRDIRGCSALLYSNTSLPVTYGVVISDAPRHQGPICIPLDENQRQRCLDIPEAIDAQIWQLAKQIARGERDPFKRIAAIENYLQTNHAYSLTTDPGAGDPVTNFLLKKNSAHCEYFASAAVILLRCLNIPARYVSGFYAHEFSGQNKKIVRARDAHAWAEAWVDGTGWVTVDATPPSGRPDMQAETPTVWRRMAEWLTDVARELVAAELWKKAVFLALAAATLTIFILRRRRKVLARPAQSAASNYSSPADSIAALANRFAPPDLARACPHAWRFTAGTCDKVRQGTFVSGRVQCRALRTCARHSGSRSTARNFERDRALRIRGENTWRHHSQRRCEGSRTTLAPLFAEKRRASGW
jgi:hypothetical protein